LAYWDHHKVLKHVSERDSELRSIKDSTESSIDVITVLKNVSQWERDAHAPEMLQMAQKSRGVKHGWTGICVAIFRARDKGIRRACGISAIRAISTVDANATFAFPESPLDRIQDKAIDEVNQETRKMNMKRFFFLLGKLGFNFVKIGIHGWMIIIGIS
jgi:hypothetical protein